jgi:hypothetical protein
MGIEGNIMGLMAITMAVGFNIQWHMGPHHFSCEIVKL